MTAHSDLIQYRWNQMDVWAAFIGLSVSPYKIPADRLNKPKQLHHGQLVDLSLSLSTEPATVGRFFREGYEWIDVPEGVSGGTLVELFSALYEHDKRKFAHFDPMMVMATTAARNVANVKAMTLTSIADANIQPFGDLALLHFEYWGNSWLRAEVLGGTFKPAEVLPFGLEFLSFPLPWFGSNPLAAPLAALVPQSIPTEKNGKKIEKVLARTQLKGAPIRAVANPDSTKKKAVTVVSIPPPRIELDGWGKQVLVPYFLKEWKTGESKIRFRITLPLPAVKTRIEILHAKNVIFHEEHSGGEFLIPGMHVWSWDGFDDDGILDTGLLKQNELSARVTVTDMAGRTAVGTTELGTGPGNIRWVDVRVDKRAKTIQVATYARFSRPSEVEITKLKIPLPGGGAIGEALTAGAAALGSNPVTSLAPMIPGLGGAMPEIPGVNLPEIINSNELSIPLTVPSVLDLEPDKHDMIKNAVIEGTGYHWSRAEPGSCSVRVNGEEWLLYVSCKERSNDAVRTFLCKALPQALQEIGLHDGSSFGQRFGERSVNLATFAEGLPIINIYEEGDEYDNLAKTGAHELGHSVLRETVNFYHSLTHKGTSTIGQVIEPSAPMLPAAGTGTEIDIMLYMQGSDPSDWRGRTRATEDDARGLVWMSQVVFG